MRELTEKLVAPRLTANLKKTRFGRLKLALLAEEKRGYEAAIESLVDYNPHARFIDLGCGDWRLTFRIAKKIGTEDISGVDLKIIENSRAKGYQSDLNHKLMVESERFDVVVASNILEHLANTDGFLKEIHRILKPSGYAVISTPNLASWHNIIYLLLGRQPEVACVSDELEGFEQSAHKRLFTFPGLIRALKLHRFKIERIVGAAYHPLPLPLARIACAVDTFHSSVINIRIRRELNKYA